MAGFLATSFDAALWGGVKDNSLQQNYGNNAQRQTASYANNTATALAEMSARLSGIPVLASPNPDEVALVTPVGVIPASNLFDFQFRIWLIPNTFVLSNPQIDTPIIFDIWNAFPNDELLSAITVVGSSVLTFGLTPAVDTITDREFRETFFEIGAGEASIAATADFVFPSGSALLTINATVSDTFDVEYNVPVVETWEFLTNVLRSHNNTEQRIQLRPDPRLTLGVQVDPVELSRRRRIYSLLMRNIQVQSLVPFFQYGTPPTATAAIGATKIFLDPALTNLRVGGFMIALQPNTEDVFISEVDTLDLDGVNTVSNITFEIDETWIVAPLIDMLIENGSGIQTKSVSSMVKINARSFAEPTLVRPDSTATINLWNSEPFLDKRPMAGADELFQFEREVTDSQTGLRDLSSAWPTPIVTGGRKFLIKRNFDPDTMDYFRDFFDTIRGSQKRFYMPTWLDDLTLAETPAQGASSFVINESDYVDVFFPFETFKNIQVELANGDISQHTVTTASTDAFLVTTITFTPALPDTPEATDIARISYLNLVRAGDRVKLTHSYNDTVLSFETRQIDG